jgi:hypothetical protein
MPTEHNKKKLQKLSDFDFSQGINHVALVTSAANGKVKPLIVKELDEYKYYVGDNENVSGAKVNMALEDALMIMFGYVPRDHARLLANSVVKSIDSSEKAVELNKVLIDFISKNGSPSGATELSKTRNEENNSMSTTDNKGASTDQVLKMADVEALITKAKDEAKAESSEAIKQLTKQLEVLNAEEEVRQDAKFGAMAESYKVLGATGETAKVLKSLAQSSPENFKAVQSLLEKAVEVTKNADKMKEVGDAGNSNVGTDSMAELKQVAAAIVKSDNVTPARAMVLAAERNPHLVK